MDKRIAFIGGGNMGGALIEGFIKSGKIAPGKIAVSDLSKEVRDKFSALGMKAFENNADCAKDADIIVVAVKPYLVEIVAGEIKGSLKEDAIIVSIAAGLELKALSGYFKKPVFRAIPNIAAMYCSSMTFVSFNSEYKDMSPVVVEMFDMAGQTSVIDEKLLDAAMVTASCGMAYALRYVRAAMEASIEMGLTAPMSRLVVSQTVKGATELLLNGDLHPETLVDMVSSPGGITIAGLNEMEHKGFTSSVISGHTAAYKKVKNK